MKKPLPVLMLAIAGIILSFLSCHNQLIPHPTLGSTGTVVGGTNSSFGESSSWGAPDNLKATQGGYREITLSWDGVGGATRYYIYRAATQFESFVQVGETVGNETSYTMKVASGVDYYYRLTAVNQSGVQSPFSTIVRGTSLAVPLVSGIEGVEGKEDSDVTVYWYMGNVDAYQSQVRYNVICYDTKGQELARVPVDGSRSHKTEAIIPNLEPNTGYQYKVEAYLISAVEKVEAGDPMDAATARRLRPNAPEELSVQQGQSTTDIVLTFKLPAMVDVALPGGFYDQYPLYFKIYRREFVEGSTDTERGWELVKADFGKTALEPAENEMQKVNFGTEDMDYTPGTTVTYVDTNSLKRGVKYEYKVQSFAYYTEREITSQYSVSTRTGWLVAKGIFGTGEYLTQKNENETANVSATLKFKLEFDTLGLKDTYQFNLLETRYPLEKDDSSAGVQGVPTSLEFFESIDELYAYTREFRNLSTPENRGYYHYSLEIFVKGGETPVETLESLGRAIVTDSVNLPVINYFSTTIGQLNTIELSWTYKENETYQIQYSDGDSLETIPHSTLVSGNPSPNTIITYQHSVGSGKEYRYTLSAANSNGDGSTDSPELIGSTSQVPEPVVKEFDYDSFKVQWKSIPAEEFVISAQYEGTTPNNYTIDSHTIPVNDDMSAGAIEYEFVQPNGFDDARVSGKPVRVTVSAKTPVRKNSIELNGETGSSYTERLEDIRVENISKSITARTMGPALINAQASLGTSETEIALTWKKVEGAKAYAVIRTQYHISSESSGNDIREEAVQKDIYIVDNSSGTPTISLAAGEVPNKNQFFTISSNDTGFTLTDKLSTGSIDDPTLESWHRSQSQLSWGAPYKYIVLPLLEPSDTPTYEYEQSAVATVGDVTLKNVQNTVGATKGYGWYVKASKGNYSQNGENTAVKISWVRPYVALATNQLYAVYRRKEGEAWEKFTTLNSNPEFIDTTAEHGVVYEYMVAPNTTDANGQGAPYNNAAYVSFSDSLLNETTGKRESQGFVLPKPIITRVTRNNVGTDRVQVFWPAINVGGKANGMIEGYIMEMRNENVSTEWQNVLDWNFTETPRFKTLTEYDVSIKNDNDRLKVTTKYKIYFRVRAYTYDENGEKVLSQAPADTFTDGFNTEVVWGARALTHEEFLWCASEVMRQGIANATNWQTQSYDWEETNSGKVYSTSSNGVGMWAFVFNNLKYNFMSVAGRLCAETSGAGGTPRYLFTNLYEGANGTFGGLVYSGVNKSGYPWLNGRPYTKIFQATYFLSQDELNALVAGKNGAGKPGEDITITGPSDVNGMYDGNIQFLDVKYEGNNPSGEGYIIVEVNGSEKRLYGGFKNYTTLPGTK